MREVNTHDIQFILRNSLNFSDTKQHIEKMCYNSSLENYKFVEYIESQIALFVDKDGEKYTAYLDYTTLEIKISISDSVVRIFGGDAGWCKAINYLSKI